MGCLVQHKNFFCVENPLQFQICHAEQNLILCAQIMGILRHGMDHAGRKQDQRTLRQRIILAVGKKTKLTFVNIGQVKEIMGVGLQYPTHGQLCFSAPNQLQFFHRRLRDSTKFTLTYSHCIIIPAKME